MQGLLNRLLVWLGLSKSRRAGGAPHGDKSDSMPGMPQTRQMEQVLESLAKGESFDASKRLQLQHQWRLVSRDGSTSSVTGTSESKKNPCPDCVAGRCGQKPEGCHCSGADKPSISLDRLTESQDRRTPLHTLDQGIAGPAMPTAKPQLFAGLPEASALGNIRLLTPGKREPLQVPTAPPRGANVSNSAAPDQTLLETANGDFPKTASAVDPAAGDELQRVIEHWPRLLQSTRQEILNLAGVSNKADSA